MIYALVDLETIQEIYPFWEHLRRSNDGTQVIIHKDILDDIIGEMPSVNNLMLEEEEPSYPFPLKTGDEINQMPEFMSEEDG